MTGAARRQTFLAQGQMAAVVAVAWITLFWVLLEHSSIWAAAAPDGGAGVDAARAYAVVVDAGSSGSRAYIYALAALGNAPPDIVLVASRKVEPGLSHFAAEPEKLDEYLVPLLRFCEASVPAAAHGATPFILMATAGMRLVEPGPREAILRATCEAVRVHTRFRLDSDCSTVQVITGPAEGIFGWLAVNYQERRLAGQANERKSAVGVVDVGGASAQIVFDVQPDSAAADGVRNFERHAAEDPSYHLQTYKLRLSWKPDQTVVTYNVYSTSHLGLGANAALARLRQAHDLSAVSGSEGDACQIAENKLTTGAFEACQAELREHDLLGAAGECALPEGLTCRINGVYQPAVAGKEFVGVSELWYSNYDVFGLTAWRSEELRERADEYCKSTHDDHLRCHNDKKYPNSDEARLTVQCFKSNWIYHLVHDGFGFVFDEASGTTLRIAAQIDGVEVSWTLGALLVLWSEHGDGPLGDMVQQLVSADEPFYYRPSRGSPQIAALLALSFTLTAAAFMAWRWVRNSRGIGRAVGNSSSLLLPLWSEEASHGSGGLPKRT